MTIHYKIDPKQSRFTAKAFASGMLSSFGHDPVLAVRDFTGEAQLTPDTFEDITLNIKVKADSLAVTNDVSEKDRNEIESKMRKEVLETATYPEITFRSTEASAGRIAGNWYRVKMKGDLSLHGVTNSEQIDTQVRVQGNILRASGEFTLKQSAYRIKPVSAAAGAIKLKDEIKFSFDIVAQREE